MNCSIRVCKEYVSIFCGLFLGREKEVLLKPYWWMEAYHSFFSPALGKRLQHGGALLLAVSLWEAPCFSARGHRNLESRGGGNLFTISLQQWNLREKSCLHQHWKPKVTAVMMVWGGVAGPELDVFEDMRWGMKRAHQCMCGCTHARLYVCIECYRGWFFFLSFTLAPHHNSQPQISYSRFITMWKDAHGLLYPFCSILAHAAFGRNQGHWSFGMSSCIWNLAVSLSVVSLAFYSFVVWFTLVKATPGQRGLWWYLDFLLDALHKNEFHQWLEPILEDSYQNEFTWLQRKSNKTLAALGLLE